MKEPIVVEETVDAPASVSHMGSFIRNSRAGRFTVEELAERAQLSAGLVSQLERGIGNPSFNTLMRLSRALGEPISAFFNGHDSEHFVLRRAERRKLKVSDGLLQEIMVADSARKLGVIRTSVPAVYSNRDTPMSHVGEEMFLVIGGTLNVVLGDKTFTLESGDSITFDSSIPHAIENVSGEQAEFIGCSTPPTTAGSY